MEGPVLKREDGFTLIETLVALVLLVSVILGLSLSAGRLGVISADADVDAAAMQAVEDRLALIAMDQRYSDLSTLYTGTESGLPGLPGSTRVTTINHVQATDTAGKVLDYREISVKVSGGRLNRSFVRTIALGAP